MRFIFDLPPDMRSALDAKASASSLTLAGYLRRLITQDTGVECSLSDSAREQRRSAGKASLASKTKKQLAKHMERMRAARKSK